MLSVAAAARRQLNHLHESRKRNHTSSPHDARVLHWHYGEYDSDDRNFQIHGETLLYIFILFSLILLVTLLLLYARWFFRLRHLPSSLSSSANPPNAAAVSLPQLIIPITRPAPPPSSRGLDRATIDSIPIILHQSPDVIDGKINRDLECCICLGVFEYGDKIKVLPSCGHRYHCDCVDAWLRDHSNCPLCRLPIAFLI